MYVDTHKEYHIKIPIELWIIIIEILYTRTLPVIMIYLNFDLARNLEKLCDT